MPILNMSPAIPDVVIDMLNNDSYNFYLTGSRFFGNYRPDSDWDFFVEVAPITTEDYKNNHSYYLHTRLLQLGFENITNEQYFYDTEIIQLYYHKHGNVHVQVVKNAPLKELAQTLLQLYYPRKFFDADDWNRAFSLARKMIIKYGIKLNG